jgi:hypothetical protein
VRAGTLTRRPEQPFFPGLEEVNGTRPAVRQRNKAIPSWAALTVAWAALALAELIAAAAAALLAPGWLDGPTRPLPDRPLLMLDIFFNNLLLALLPLVGGWLAAGHLLAGRRRLAWLFVLLPALVVARSVVTIGAVGGADPGWLLDAARWWLLELAALAAAGWTGMWLMRHPELRERLGPAAARRALAVVVPTLVAGAGVEVLTA